MVKNSLLADSESLIRQPTCKFIIFSIKKISLYFFFSDMAHFFIISSRNQKNMLKKEKIANKANPKVFRLWGSLYLYLYYIIGHR